MCDVPRNLRIKLDVGRVALNTLAYINILQQFPAQSLSVGLQYSWVMLGVVCTML